MIFAIEQPPADSGGHIEEGYVADRGGGAFPVTATPADQGKRAGRGDKKHKVDKNVWNTFCVRSANINSVFIVINEK